MLYLHSHIAVVASSCYWQMRFENPKIHSSSTLAANRRCQLQGPGDKIAQAGYLSKPTETTASSEGFPGFHMFPTCFHDFFPMMIPQCTWPGRQLAPSSISCRHPVQRRTHGSKPPMNPFYRALAWSENYGNQSEQLVNDESCNCRTPRC